MRKIVKLEANDFIPEGAKFLHAETLLAGKTFFYYEAPVNESPVHHPNISMSHAQLFNELLEFRSKNHNLSMPILVLKNIITGDICNRAIESIEGDWGHSVMVRIKTLLGKGNLHFTVNQGLSSQILITVKDSSTYKSEHFNIIHIRK